MTLAVYSAACAGFCLAFYSFAVTSTARRILEVILVTVGTTANIRTDDDIKAKTVRRNAGRLFVITIVLLVKFALVLAVTGGIVYGAHSAGWSSIGAVTEFSLRTDVIIYTTVILIALFVIWRRIFPPPALGRTNYSSWDQILHHVAFSHWPVTRIFGNSERKSKDRPKWQAIDVKAPVFITALPRAGTTILLEVLSRLPGVANHTYRDMPFLLTPVLWQRLSRRLSKQDTGNKERAHGDGMQISADSPEAFEEILWSRAFPQKYNAGEISLWQATDEKFGAYFKEHIQKILFLRGGSRYVSKNNANIARIPALLDLFPDAKILVPLRDPVGQARSLHRQHQNFLEQHKDDPFVEKYMADIGHFEFGNLHKVILFPGVKEAIAGLGPDKVDYWLAYWLASYSALAETKGVLFVHFENLSKDSAKQVNKLVELLDLPAGENEIKKAAGVLRVTTGKSDDGGLDPALVKKCRSLHRQLAGRCVV